MIVERVGDLRARDHIDVVILGSHEGYLPVGTVLSGEVLWAARFEAGVLIPNRTSARYLRQVDDLIILGGSQLIDYVVAVERREERS